MSFTSAIPVIRNCTTKGLLTGLFSISHRRHTSPSLGAERTLGGGTDAFMVSFFIPCLLPSVNDIVNANRRSRWDGAGQKRETQSDIVTVIRVSKVKPVEKYPVFVELTWYEPNRKRDPDNIAGAKKFIMDALQEAGIIRNDGWNEIAGYADFYCVAEPEDTGVLVRLVEAGD